jgi:hypothetical protein
MIKKIDENTGREVRQITSLPYGARTLYFRTQRLLPDGRMIGAYHADDTPPFHHNDILVFDPESGDVEFPKRRVGSFLKLLDDGRGIFCTKGEKREIWAMPLPNGEPELIGCIPEEVPGNIHTSGQLHNLTCDGETVILVDYKLLQPADSVKKTADVLKNMSNADDVGAFWRHIYRPRTGDIYAYNLKKQTLTRCVHLDGYSIQHTDPSPVDPTLMKFAQDGLAVFDQRIWAVRTDGSGLMKIRPQQKGEWVHHEFWWPGGQFIGYKYVDRRSDPTIHELPWGELAPRPLQLGIADLTGREVYLSDPLCCYQSHLQVSRKGDMISGEGTLNNCFVHAGPFSWSDCKIDLQRLATIHTPYRLSMAQSVEAGFSADSRWMVYTDKVGEHFQIHAVKV